MRIIRLPHNIIHADGMTQLDTGFLIPEININLPAKKLAGFGFNPFVPQMPLLPFVITGFENEIDPAQSRLGANPFQTGIAFEDSREDQIRDELRGCSAEP